MEESTFMDGVRAVFAIIDRGVYGLITTFYNLIESLATFTIIDSGTIVEISGRIYALIALFMIFKISFSLINYLVNPDILSDKVKGGGALIKNIIITLALVILVPFGFDILYEAQAAILSDNLIGKLIHGGEVVDGEMEFSMDEKYCDTNATTSNSGDYIGLMAFKPFFQLSEESLKNSSDFSGDTKTWYCAASVNGGKASVKNLLANNKVYSAPHGWSAEHFYVVDYTIFLSTVVGVILALVFLSFSFDVATRTIKLQFLEILAPIPVISYIDPDKSKNGMFSKWLKEVATTWLSLFLRLLAYNIAIYAISLIGDMELEGDSLWIRLLIIIGILMFAKQLPKLLENIMGIKMSGSFNLNPFKKLDDEALGFKAGRKFLGKATAATAATGMAVVGSIYGRNKAKEKFKKDNEKIETDFLNKKRQLITDMYNGQITPAEMNQKMAKLLNTSVAKKQAVEKNYDKFSNRHPVWSGIMAAGRAGSEAFKADHKSIRSIIENASKAATNAAKERTYRDNYDMGNRIMNTVTDWGDVKKSGTADVVDRRVKELNDQLSQVTNALDSLRQEQSTFAPGTFTWATSGPNAGMITVSPTVDPNVKALAEENVRLQQELQQTMKDLNSEIKSQNKILEQSKK